MESLRALGTAVVHHIARVLGAQSKLHCLFYANDFISMPQCFTAAAVRPAATYILTAPVPPCLPGRVPLARGP